MQQIPEEPNISIRISWFNNIFKSSDSRHVDKTKLIKKPKPWINPHVWTMVSNRNRLRCTIHENQQEWIDALDL